MIEKYLKYQFRQGLFFIPIIVIPIYYITNNYVLVFILLQSRFFNSFQQKDFHLPIIHICGAQLKSPFKWYNLSWALWFNLWFIVTLAIQVFWFKSTIQLHLVELINFNSILFMSFIIGNMLSNSDLVTIKSSILRLLALSFIFSFSVSVVYSICFLINSFHNSLWGTTFLFIIIIQSWIYSISKHKHIKYISYYL